MTGRSLALTHGERTTLARVEADGSVLIDAQRFHVESAGTGLYHVSDGTRHWMVAVAGPREDRWIGVSGQVAQVDVVSATDRPARRRAASHDLTAPMPATVIRVSVEPGAHITAGTVLIVLEAMKMELAIRAPRDGVVRAIHCQPGELVQPGVPLLELM